MSSFPFANVNMRPSARGAAAPSRATSSSSSFSAHKLPFANMPHLRPSSRAPPPPTKKRTFVQLGGDNHLPFAGMEHCRVRQPEMSPVNPLPNKQTFERLCQEYISEHTAPISVEKQQEIYSYVQHLPSGEANGKWLDSRRGKITGSATGGIYGFSPYNTEEDVVKNMLWPSFSPNVCTRWGNDNEDTAQEAYEEWWQSLVGTQVERGPYPDGTDPPWWANHTLLESRVQNVGLVLNCEHPWKGMSPDGVNHLTWHQRDARQSPRAADRDGSEIKETILIEYKCPYGQRNTTSLTQKHLYPTKVMPNGKRMPIPKYYYCQITHGMDVLQGTFLPNDQVALPRTDFVVWAPAFPATPSDQSVVNNPSTPFVVRDFTEESPFSRNIATSKGLIEVTEATYDPVFAKQFQKKLWEFWSTRYVPGAVLQELGCLRHGDIVAAVDIDA
jgi:hypothetical protein